MVDPLIACVLKSGGEYTLDYVHALQRQIDRPIVCLTDKERPATDGITFVALTEGWPGWWSKLELFRPGLFTRPVVYLDLDTMAVRPINRLLALDPGPNLYMLQDLAYSSLRANSGVMAWRPATWLDKVYYDFKANARAERVRYTDAGEGDGDFICDRLWARVSLLQDALTGYFVSYKWQAKEKIPPAAHVVCFHGKPRPHAVTDGWAAEHWKKFTTPPGAVCAE